MDKEDLIVLGLAGVAVLLILKSGGVKMPTIISTGTGSGGLFDAKLFSDTPWYSTGTVYDYTNDSDGHKFSQTGADVRARR